MTAPGSGLSEDEGLPSRDTVLASLLAIVLERASALAVAASGDGVVMLRLEGADAACARDLERALVGNVDAVRHLLDSLEGQRLPRLWTQGDVHGAVFLPLPDLVVALFERTDADVVGSWRAFDALAARLEAPE